jgi:hypothetical protein
MIIILSVLERLSEVKCLQVHCKLFIIAQVFYSFCESTEFMLYLIMYLTCFLKITIFKFSSLGFNRKVSAFILMKISAVLFDFHFLNEIIAYFFLEISHY